MHSTHKDPDLKKKKEEEETSCKITQTIEQ